MFNIKIAEENYPQKKKKKIFRKFKLQITQK
jgi:hypothetical protein